MAKKEEPKAIKEYRENIRNKSLRQLVTEAHEAPQEPTEGEKTEIEPKEVEEKAEVRLQTPEERNAELEEFKKTATEAAKLAAEESAKKLKEEIQKIKESSKTENEKKEEINELKASWTGRDPQGNPTPKSYDEIVTEARKLAFEDYKKFYQEQKAQELEEVKKAQEEESRTKEKQEQEYQDRLKNINNRIESEMEELYAAGKLTKPKDVNDLNDPSARRVKDLFDQAAAHNLQQQREGKPLVDSIAKFYFLHYKPAEDRQPAGADAPIIGNKAAPAQQEEKIDYYRDIHAPSFKQIMYRAKKMVGR